LIKATWTRLHALLLRHYPLQLEALRWYADQLRRCWRRDPWDPLPQPTQVSAEFSGWKPSGMLILGMHWLALGGAEAFAIDCLHMALSSGWRVWVITDHGSPSFYTLPVGVQHVPLQGLTQDQRIERILELLRSCPGAVVHNHHCISLYAALSRIRSELDAHSVRLIDSLHIEERLDGGFVRISSVWGHYLDSSHVISARLVGLLRKHSLTRDIRLGYLLPNQDVSSFPRPNLLTSLEHGRLCLCILSRLVWQKRPFLTCELAKHLLRWGELQGFTQLQLKVIGSGPLQPVLMRHLQRDPVLKCYASYENATPNAREALAGSDLLLQCSANEGITISSFEALERGCLVLSTAVGAQRELLADAFLLPADPLKALLTGFSKAQRLLEDAHWRDQAIHSQSICWNALRSAPRGLDVVRQMYGLVDDE
jgi:glycosyltransferase involved in cell wall biosynthesis